MLEVPFGVVGATRRPGRGPTHTDAGRTPARTFALARSGAFERVAQALAAADRERAGLGASPTAAAVDAQAARSGGVGVAGRRGYDAAKRVVGRKRHALVDADGRLLLTAVSPADLHDSHGGTALLRTSRRSWPSIALRYADRASAGPRVAEAAPVRIRLVGPKPGQRGFAVQPHRWVSDVVFPRMARPDVLAIGTGGQHVADLDLGVGDDHAVDQQQHELPALLEGRRGQPVLHPAPEGLQ